jgi:hypothetical protein
MDRLQAALANVETTIHLIKDNEYGKYMCGSLYTVKYELLRQLTNIQLSDIISDEE